MKIDVKKILELTTIRAINATYQKLMNLNSQMDTNQYQNYYLLMNTGQINNKKIEWASLKTPKF